MDKEKDKIKKDSTKDLSAKVGRIEREDIESGTTSEALLNMLEDVEEARRRAEEERDKTLAVITNFADGLVVFDPENNLSLINPQAEEFLEVKSEEITGKNILELPEHPQIVPLVNLLGPELKSLFRKEITIGKGLILEVSTIPIMREDRKLGTLIILHDITREKAIERMKTEFVSIAAHQLRTPLSAIKWTLKMLLEGDLGRITKEQREFIEKTYGSNERMITLINDLLNVTRIEEGRYLYKPTTATIENIITFVLNSHKEKVEKKNMELTFQKTKEKMPKAMVDVEKMRLAIDNLLDNAIKYTNPGGKVTVSLKYKEKEKEIELSIQDTGVGIPEDQQKRVFTKFFRGANVMRMETEGSGLGLFITKNVIEAHGGKIWFESKEGKGTTFYFTLPVKKEFEKFIEGS